jgi:MerR HTH family regulatory protein
MTKAGAKRIETFSAGQAVKLSGVPYATLDYWVRSGFLSPSVEEAAGKGTDRTFSFRDVVALRVAQRLREAGVSLESLREAARRIRRLRSLGSTSDALSSTYLVSDGRTVYEKTGDELVDLVRRPGQLAFAWFIDLGQVVEEIRKKMAA